MSVEREQVRRLAARLNSAGFVERLGAGIERLQRGDLAALARVARALAGDEPVPAEVNTRLAVRLSVDDDEPSLN